MSDIIRIGWKMIKWMRSIIRRDFGKVSDAKGLYSILCLYEKYVPEHAKLKHRGGKRRLLSNNGFR